MNTKEITTREKLKKYFETGKYPSESQFAELIDALRLKEDILSTKEMIMLNNSLESIDNGYFSYTANNIEDLNFSILISQQNEEDQLIEFGNTYGNEKKQYFLGKAPYIIKVQDFHEENLKEYEYLFISYRVSEKFTYNRLFGEGLYAFPKGFEFGTLQGKRFYMQISKLIISQKVSIVNMPIKFVNKTGVPIEYRLQSGYWNNEYTDKDIITDHYNVSDSFYFYYKADLRGIDKSIECKLYDADTDQLIMTGYLSAGQNNQDMWGGGQTYGTKNIRIECNYTD